MRQMNTEHIQTLFRTLSDRKNVIELQAGGLISINNTPQSETVLIHSGYALIRRTADRLIIGTFRGPIIFGFNSYLNLEGEVYIEALTELEFELMSSDVMLQKAEKNNLWRPLLDVTMFISAALFIKNRQLSIRDSMSVILYLLESLAREPDFIRLKTTAADYILQRSNLSRSGVMKHLATLRKKNIVILDSGVLVSTILVPENAQPM